MEAVDTIKISHAFTRLYKSSRSSRYFALKDQIALRLKYIMDGGGGGGVEIHNVL